MLKKEKEQINNKIIYYQKDLKRFYLNNSIKDDDIIWLFSMKPLEFLRVLKKYGNNPRYRVLASIYFSPFVLYKQEYLSDKLKGLIPFIINTRFIIEMEELDFQFNNSSINEQEYKKIKDRLIYCYYKSTEEGKNIFLNKKTTNKQKTMI